MTPFTLVAGPCVIEDEGFVLEVAQECKHQLKGLEVDYYFKSSFDKANRTSIQAFRGPGLHEGLRILEKVKSQLNLKVFTDFHETHQIEAVASVVDFLQIPAFLCRQTDMVVGAAQAAVKNKIRLNIKKGQFVAPWDMQYVVQKVKEAAFSADVSDFLYLTERGTCFGYNNLIVDMSSFKIMKTFGVPVLYDATHSVQKPSANGGVSGGMREHIEVLAQAALAAGADGLFIECHPHPPTAKSDGATSLYLDQLGRFVKKCIELKKFVFSL